MITIRKSSDRGQVDIGWLHSQHSFSFGSYYDPRHMGFGFLRVINDDIVRGGGGFGTHPHDNMEIVTYVLNGALEHKDSMGNGSVIQAGDVQRMSAGTGLTHSEFNASTTDSVRLLQIWFRPKLRDIAPTYAQAHFDAASKQGKLKLVLSEDGREGSVNLNQDVDMYAGVLTNGDDIRFPVRAGRKVWLQVAEGTLSFGESTLEAGDGVAIEGEDTLKLHSAKNAHILVMDMTAA